MSADVAIVVVLLIKKALRKHIAQGFENTTALSKSVCPGLVVRSCDGEKLCVSRHRANHDAAGKVKSAICDSSGIPGNHWNLHLSPLMQNTLKTLYLSIYALGGHLSSDM
jgi:hypothetical protein